MSSLILGLGCDRNTGLQTIETAVEQALLMVGFPRASVQSLATIDKKSDEVALLAYSEKYDWPLYFFSAEQLREVDVPNPSGVVMKYVGTPAVAEAAAMLLAQCGTENLILEKHKYCGEDHKNVTVSIVRINKENLHHEQG